METNGSVLEANKKTARQAHEAFEKNDVTLLDKITDPGYKIHFPGQPKELNYEESKKLQADYNAAFPDAKITIEQQIAERDMVLSRLTYTGTHKGKMQGIAPTGKSIKVTGMSLQRFEKGKIVEEWVEFDMLGMLQQIGAVTELANA